MMPLPLWSNSRHRQNGPAPAALGYYYGYCSGQLDRKAVLDQAGVALSPRQAQTQICEAAFWMAQHEAGVDNHAAALELLQLGTQVPLPDLAEFQFAIWQLARISD